MSTHYDQKVQNSVAQGKRDQLRHQGLVSVESFDSRTYQQEHEPPLIYQQHLSQLYPYTQNSQENHDPPYHQILKSNPHIGYRCSTASGASTPELLDQPQTYERQHSYPISPPGQQTYHHILPPDSDSYVSELIFAFHLSPVSPQSSSLRSESNSPTRSHALEDVFGERKLGCPEALASSEFGTSNANQDGTSPSVKRKHTDSGVPHQPKDMDADTNSSPNDEIHSVADAAASKVKRRSPRACIHCQKAKMKCEFQQGKRICERCEFHGRDCTIEPRRSRIRDRRDYYLTQLKQKDARIEFLLQQLHKYLTRTPASIAPRRTDVSPTDHNTLFDNQTHSRTDAEGSAWPVESMTLESDDHNTIGRKENSSSVNRLPPLLNSHSPLSMIAEFSQINTDGKKLQDFPPEERREVNDVGIVNKAYVEPGSRTIMVEQHNLPEIISYGIATPEDANRLFEIFYEHINPFIPLLDPVLHTPESTYSRCPFLYNIVCAVSSKYDTNVSDIYPVAMRFAKNSAVSALIDGEKSVELCQAFILMSMYAVPTQRWEEDRSWLYTGLAMRIATDLDLHQASTIQPQNERQEREILNRMRVWLICCNLDLSTATQFGKPPTIREDYITLNVKEWYRTSKYNSTHDIHCCARLALLQVNAGFRDKVLNSPLDPKGLSTLCSTIMDHEAQLSKYHEEWLTLFIEHSDANDFLVFRCSLLAFLVDHSRLVMYSFAFNQICQRGTEPSDIIYLAKILDAAKIIIERMTGELAPTGYMHYAPDEFFMVIVFASVFIIKLLRLGLFSEKQESELLELIERLVHVLSFERITVGDRHISNLHARFLAKLVSRHRSNRAPGESLDTHLQQSGILSTREPSPHSASVSHSKHPTTVNERERNNTLGQSHGDENLNHTVDTTTIYQPDVIFEDLAGIINFGADAEFHLWDTWASQIQN